MKQNMHNSLGKRMYKLVDYDFILDSILRFYYCIILNPANNLHLFLQTIKISI